MLCIALQRVLYRKLYSMRQAGGEVTIKPSLDIVREQLPEVRLVWMRYRRWVNRLEY